MAALLAVFAEFEREILRERVRAGLAHARQKGQKTGPPHHRWNPCRPSAETASRWHQQIRNRPPPANRPHLSAPDSGLTYFPEKQGQRFSYPALPERTQRIASIDWCMSAQVRAGR